MVDGQQIGKQIPVGVKIISVLYYISAVFGILVGLLFLVGAGMMSSIADKIPLLGALFAVLFVLFVLSTNLFIGGIILMGLGILGFFVGKGLWKARPWARIVAIIIAALGILMAIISMIPENILNNIFILVIELVIGGYLLFSSSVKEAFV